MPAMGKDILVRDVVRIAGKKYCMAVGFSEFWRK